MAAAIAVIDNYDSFTWNIVQYLEERGARCTVVESDRIDVAALVGLAPDGIVLSPGPGSPAEAGVTLEVVARLSDRIPILGICLGFQAIGLAFGATVRRASRPVHGRTSAIRHSGDRLFAGIPSPFRGARYHSLSVDAKTLPADIEATAFSEDGELMALRHLSRPISGVQFHPESLLSEHGKTLFDNWLRTS